MMRERGTGGLENELKHRARRGLDIKRFWRYLIRVRTFLLVLAIPALSWWIALHAFDREALHGMALEHELLASQSASLSESTPHTVVPSPLRTK
jgi:hypothetical protein